MDKGIKLTEKEKAELIERVNLFIENHSVPTDTLEPIRSDIILNKDIDKLIDRINSLKYTDNLEDCTVRMIDYLLLLYNIYYNIYSEYMVGEYLSTFKLYDINIKAKCVRMQSYISYKVQKHIEADVYTGSTSKWTDLVKELDEFYDNIESASKEEIAEKAEYIKEKLRIHDCGELFIKDYNYNKLSGFNAAGFDKIQPVFKVIEYYYLLSGDENAK